jgi:hypothetical protein
MRILESFLRVKLGWHVRLTTSLPPVSQLSGQSGIRFYVPETGPLVYKKKYMQITYKFSPCLTGNITSSLQSPTG